MTEVTRLFENLITMDEFLASLGNAYTRRTVYSWISKGLPHKKVNGGKIWIVKDSAAKWLERNN